MGRFATLKRKADFDHVFRRGKRSKSSILLVAGVRSPDTSRGECRFGFQIRRTCGKSVVRNRLRRRLKEAARRLTQNMAEVWDIVIIALPAAIDKRYQDLERELERALARLCCLSTTAVVPQ